MTTPIDIFTKVLLALRLTAAPLERLTFSERMVIRPPHVNSAGFYVVERGQVFLGSPTDGPLLKPGDVVIVSGRGEIHLLPDESASPMLLAAAIHAPHDVSVALFNLLPALMVIEGEEGRLIDALEPTVRFLFSESGRSYAGKEAVLSRLIEVLFIMVVRYWMYTHAPSPNWFQAMLHPQIGEVLRLIHDQPDQPWTVTTLGAAVNLSRSALAAHFSAAVGDSPMRYLTRWRIQVAASLLIEQPMLSLDAIARRVGYESGYGLSKSFKRWVGKAPGQYRDEYWHTAQPAADEPP
ncbi:MAG: AraC family transcriptional regulator [bacterium]|nr:AraC family transcriptional regulator [bacterium]